jgi:hypothetical protein
MSSHGILTNQNKDNTSSSTSQRGVPKQKNQHLQFRIEIMPKKEELYLSKMQIQRLCELPAHDFDMPCKQGNMHD